MAASSKLNPKVIGSPLNLHFIAFSVNPRITFSDKSVEQIFSHTLKYGFKNDTLGAFADVFVCRNYLNTILAKLCLVVSRVITITNEPVQFSNNDNIKHILCRILNHFLKRRTLVGSSGERSSIYESTIVISLRFAKSLHSRS